MRTIFQILLSCLLITQMAAQDKPTNIILLIGDGMGVAQMSTAYYFQDSTPQISRFPVVGLHNSSSAKEKITDSAAGATAFACGIRSYNGAIAVDTNKQAAPTLVEILSPLGYNTAVLATSSITHATPASFYAHQPSRKMQEEIAADMIHSEVDFFAGGGINFFAARTDSLNYIDSLRHQNFSVTVDSSSLFSLPTIDTAKKYGFLNAADGMPTMEQGRGNYLQRMTNFALDYLTLKNEPFFMMVESSQIDWGGHANDADYIITEMLDFDALIGDVLDFAAKDGNTLVIVTADHETGGFSLSAQEIRLRGDYRILNPTFSTGGHSASMVPVLAYGPGSMTFTGLYPNNQVFHKILQVMKIK